MLNYHYAVSFVVQNRNFGMFEFLSKDKISNYDAYTAMREIVAAASKNLSYNLTKDDVVILMCNPIRNEEPY